MLPAVKKNKTLKSRQRRNDDRQFPQNLKNDVGGNFRSPRAVFLKSVLPRTNRRIGNAANGKKRNRIDVAHMRHRCRFHICGQRRVFPVKEAAHTAVDKPVSGHDQPPPHFCIPAANSPGGCQQKRIGLKTGSRQPRMKFGQNTVINIMIKRRFRNNRIKQPDTFVHPAGSSRINDRVNAVIINQNLCRRRRIHFADAAENPAARPS